MPNARRYVPSEIWGGRLVENTFESPHRKIDFIMAPCACCGICSACGFHGVSSDGIIVAIDGACRNNGLPGARAAFGVYFNAQSTFNLSVLLPPGETPPSNQRAELAAAAMALVQCYLLKIDPDCDQQINQVVIKSDSTYLVNAMVSDIEKWRLNGYKTTRGPIAINKDSLRLIDEAAQRLEALGVDVRFWHVPRTHNKQADRLVNAALDGVDHTQLTMKDYYG